MGARKAFGAAILTSLIAVAAVAAPAGATTITVNTTADVLTEGGLCSLRQAIETVNGEGDGACGAASSGANTIVLRATTYPLTRGAFLIIGKLPEGCISIAKEGPDNNSAGELSVAENVKELTIEGAGPGQTILDACKLDDRALQVKPGAGVTLKGLTITNGNAPDGAAGTAGATNGSHGGAAEPGADGGGILNEGNLTLTDTAITNNHAGSGGTGGKGGPLGGSGGIGAGGGSGGAIASTGTLTVSESTISENSAGSGGGGGEATASSTGQGGSGASGGNGGGGAGIANFGGTATIEKSTITANTAGAGGAGSSGKNSGEVGGGGSGGDGGSGGNGAGIAIAGALFKPAAVLQATDDTIQGNIAGDGANGGNPGERSSDIFADGKAGNGGDGGFGGGVENLLNTATQLVNLTIAENSAGHAGLGGTALETSPPGGTNGEAGHGGGVYGLTSPTLQNTILYENQTGDDCRGTIVDGGHNLVFSKPSLKGLVTDLCKFSAVTTEDPKLAPLAANAGPTQTMRPQAGSAAIDQVPAAGAGCPATDQRGVPRPGGAACDIGAYEVVAPKIANVVASAISTSAATLSATVAADAPAATVQFQFGTTTAYGFSTTPQSATGLSPVALLAQLSALAPGTTFHFRVIASNPDGTSTSADRTFTTAGNRALTAAAGAPVLTNVAESNHRWRDGTRLASFARKAKRPPVGTTFSFTLNQAAIVSFSFTQGVGGRKVKSKCVAQTKKNRHQHACKRTVTRGTLSFAAHAGTNKAVFQGRISHALKLKPGTYALVITARNSAGQSSSPARLSFTVVR
jgi:CSLREA domain-containing protein